MSDSHDKDDKIEDFKKKLKDLLEDSKKTGNTPIKNKKKLYDGRDWFVF